jgi:hypothetical protein
MKTKCSLPLALSALLLILAPIASGAPCSGPGSILRVKNTHIGNYEYVVFDYRRPPNPHYTVTTETGSTFIHDASGDNITVAGNKFRQIRFTGVFWTCTINETFSLPKTAIKDVKKHGAI